MSSQSRRGHKIVSLKYCAPTACTDKNAAGDMLLPTFSKGTPDIDEGVYEYMKKLWKAECESDQKNYRSSAFHQGSKK